MATSVLDVRDALAPSPVRGAVRPAAPTARATGRRRPPAPVVAAGLVGVAEAVGLLAVGLTGLDGLLVSPVRPPGWLVAGVLAGLAAWVVGSAGGAVALVDGAGRRLLLGLSYAELVLVSALFVVAVSTTLLPAGPRGLPLPAFAVLLVAVPVGKLLLAGTPSAQSWVAAGPATRSRRPDPVAAHRLLCTLTLAGIGLALGVLAVLAPIAPAAAGAPTAEVAGSH